MDAFTQKSNFISNEECEFLVWMAESGKEWDYYPGSFLNQRTIDFFTTLQHRYYASLPLQRLSLQIFRKTQEYVSKFIGSDVNVEFMAILRMEPGAQQELFTYNASAINRVAESVIFLNDDFEGGLALYPNINKTIKPQVGLIYAARTGDDHTHGVSMVSGSTRYAIISGWTNKPLTDALDRSIEKLEDYILAHGQQEFPVVG